MRVADLLDYHQITDGYPEQLVRPIEYTGPGWYSLDDGGTYRPGQAATYSRIFVHPCPIADLPIKFHAQALEGVR